MSEFPPEDNATTPPKYQEFVDVNLSTPTPNAAKKTRPSYTCFSLLRHDPDDDEGTRGLKRGLVTVLAFAYVIIGILFVAIIVVVATPEPKAGEDSSNFAAYLRHICHHHLGLLGIAFGVSLLVLGVIGALMLRALDKKTQSRRRDDIELGKHGDRQFA
jgi:hypothetical protein